MPPSVSPSGAHFPNENKSDTSRRKCRSHKVIADWFAAKGWAPRKHQLDVLAAWDAGASALLIAPTGAGKTLAGFLPTLVDLVEASADRHPHALHLAAEGAGGRRRAQPHDARSRR